MLLEAWLLIGIVATIGTAILLFAPDRAQTNAVMTLLAAIMMVLWGIFAYGALGVEVHSGGETEIVEMPAIALIATLGSVLSFIMLLTGPLELIARWRDDPSRI